MQLQLLQQDIHNNQLQPVYLFYGEETWLIDEAVQSLRAAVAPQSGEWGVEILDGSAISPAMAVAAALEGNLFGGARLVVVKYINWLETAKKTEAKAAEAKAAETKSADGKKTAEADICAPLLAYLEAPNPSTCLALTVRGNVDKRRKLIQVIQKRGRLIECTTPKGSEKDLWLINRISAAGLKADRRAIAHISISCANLSQMATEADKLILYCADKGEISMEDARALVSESSLLTVFELTDAAAAKNAAKACSCYRRLLRQGEEEQKIFALLAAQFRNILLIQDMLKHGHKPGEIAKYLSLHPFVVDKCAGAARAFSQRQLIKALEMLLAADIAQKSGHGDMDELLETVILRICALPDIRQRIT